MYIYLFHVHFGLFACGIGHSDILDKSGSCRCKLQRACEISSRSQTVFDIGRVEMESGGTRRCTGGEVKGKEANGVGRPSSLQFDSEQSIQCYYNRSPPTRTPRKPVLD